MKPIEIFKNDEQLTKSMLEWKDILMLNDWTITSSLRSLEELSDGDEDADVLGKSKLNQVNKTSAIYVCDGVHRPVLVERFCAEEILVHELLHCKLNIVSNEETYEGVMLGLHEHQLLESMAKSLIMARYNLPFSYWKDPFWDTEFSYEYPED